MSVAEKRIQTSDRINENEQEKWSQHSKIDGGGGMIAVVVFLFRFQIRNTLI